MCIPIKPKDPKATTATPPRDTQPNQHPTPQTPSPSSSESKNLVKYTKYLHKLASKTPPTKATTLLSTLLSASPDFTTDEIKAICYLIDPSLLLKQKPSFTHPTPTSTDPLTRKFDYVFTTLATLIPLPTERALIRKFGLEFIQAITLEAANYLLQLAREEKSTSEKTLRDCESLIGCEERETEKARKELEVAEEWYGEDGESEEAREARGSLVGSWKALDKLRNEGKGLEMRVREDCAVVGVLEREVGCLRGVVET